MGQLGAHLILLNELILFLLCLLKERTLDAPRRGQGRAGQGRAGQGRGHLTLAPDVPLRVFTCLTYEAMEPDFVKSEVPDSSKLA